MLRKFINRKNICAVLAMVLGLAILTSASLKKEVEKREKTEVATNKETNITRQKL